MAIMFKIDDLQVGMCLGEDIMSGMHTLMSKGRELTADDIGYLKKKFPDLSVQIDDGTNNDPEELEELSPEVAQQIEQNFKRVVEKAGSFVKHGKTIDEKRLQEIEDAISEMLKFIKENPMTMNLLEQSSGWHEYLRDHGLSVFYYTTMLGFALQDHFNEINSDDDQKCVTNGLRPVATAALFHDIGMVPIQHLYDKSGKPDDKEWSSIKAHPAVAMDILPEEIGEEVRNAIQHHHENYDGSGYPYGISGDDINIFSRILRITDAFAAATTATAYRKKKSQIQVLFEMINGEFRNCYDPGLLKVFANILQPLPVGAKLRLNTGQWAVVVQQNPKNPFNPMLLIAFDYNNVMLPKGQMEKPFYLSDRNDIEIVAFGKKALPFMKDFKCHAPFKSADEALEKTCAALFEAV